MADHDDVAEEWAVFVSGTPNSVPEAFVKASQLLLNMKPGPDELPSSIEERLEALRQPLPACFAGSDFRSLVEKQRQDVQHLLRAALAPAPVAPATMEEIAKEEVQAAPPAAKAAAAKPPAAKPPTAQQLVNALDAMTAGSSRIGNSAGARLKLFESGNQNTFTQVVFSRADSPIKFLIAEARDNYNAEEIYVAFPGTECWEDLACDAAIYSKATPNGRYHYGFFERAAKFPLAGLAERVLDGAKLFFVGHSLGGAVATVVTIEMLAKYASLPRDRVHCITAGAPLVGDANLRQRCEQLDITDCLYHMVEPDDGIPRLLSLVGAARNFANCHKEKLRKVVGVLAQQCCNGRNNVQLAVETMAGETAESMATLFLKLTIPEYEPVGKYWIVSTHERTHENGKETKTAIWCSAERVKRNLQAPSSYGDVQNLLEQFCNHELRRYNSTVKTTFGLPSSPDRMPEDSTDAATWMARVTQCRISASSGRLACTVAGEKLSFVRSVLVGRQRFDVDSKSVTSSSRLAIEIDCMEGEPFEAAEAQVTVVSMIEGCSFTSNLEIVVSEMRLQGYGEAIASLELPAMLGHVLKTELFRPAGTARPDDESPLRYLEALAGCQPIETLFSFLASKSSRAAMTTFLILGRLGSVEQLTKLGVSSTSHEFLKEAISVRQAFRAGRYIQSKGGSKSGAVGGISIVGAGVSTVAAAAERLSPATTASQTQQTLNVQKISVKSTGTFSRQVHREAVKQALLEKAARAAAQPGVQNLSTPPSIARKIPYVALVLFGIATVGTAIWESYSIHCAKQLTAKGIGYTDIHRERALKGTDLVSGPKSWDEFDCHVAKGLQIADEVIAKIEAGDDVISAVSALKVFSDLFPNAKVFDCQRILTKQRQEMHDCHESARTAAGDISAQVKAQEDCTKMMDIHTHWIDCISVSLSRKTDVAVDRSTLSAALGVSKLFFANALRPWSPATQLLSWGAEKWKQEYAKNYRDATSEVLSLTDFESRVDILFEGIVGAASEHLFESRKLYSKLYAIRKHAPHGIAWCSRPIDISSRWVKVMREPGIVPNSTLAGITKDSRFEVACWLVSCLCLVELYDSCMSVASVAVMGATETGKSSLTRALSLNPEAVVAGGLSRHRTSIPLMHLCKPFAEDQKPFSILDMPGLTDRENAKQEDQDENEETVLDEDWVDLRDETECLPGLKTEFLPGLKTEFLPGLTSLPLTRLCSAMVVFLPHRLVYTVPFRMQLLNLFSGGVRTVESGGVMVFITKCEDVIDEALKLPAADATELIRQELEDEVRRMKAFGIMGMANTRYAVVCNPRKYSSGDLQRLGVWQLEDIHKWMSDSCN